MSRQTTGWDDRRPMSAAGQLPHARGWPLLGRLPAFAFDLLGLCRQAAPLGPLVDISPGHLTLQVNDPALIGQVLVTQNRAFAKVPGSPLRFLVGNGLFTNEDPDDHRRQRRLMQPAFHRERVAAFGAIMTDATHRHLAAWPDEGRLDLHVELMDLTLTIVARCLFGVDPAAEDSAAAPALTRALAGFASRMPPYGLAFLLGPWLHRHADRVAPRLESANAVLEQFVQDLVARRRQQAAPADDLLAMLLAARDVTGDGAGMTDRQVRDEILTLFVAGHETTANALAWSLLLLAQNPAAQERLAAEAAALGDRPASAADLENLPYTKMVLSEALRLYPPVWLISRQAVADVRLGDTPLAAGTRVFICPFTLHRRPEYWDEPLAFRPERFGADGPGERPRYAYIPFGAGPRLCLGEPFAWLEGTLLLATLARQFRFAPTIPPEAVRLNAQATLQPRDGLTLRLRRR